MQIDMSEIYDDIFEKVSEGKQNSLHDYFDSIEFKLLKNAYHYDRIMETIKHAGKTDSDEFYNQVHLPIYFEMESFLVSLRSSVDVCLHLLNFVFDMDLKQNEVNLHTVFHHPQLPKSIRNIFERYTRPYNNPTWNFIYTSRNEVVHEKSVNQVLPLNIDFFSTSEPLFFFLYEKNDREMATFFNQCLKFLDTFISQLLQALKISI